MINQKKMEKIVMDKKTSKINHGNNKKCAISDGTLFGSPTTIGISHEKILTHFYDKVMSIKIPNHNPIL